MTLTVTAVNQAHKLRVRLTNEHELKVLSPIALCMIERFILEAATAVRLEKDRKLFELERKVVEMEETQ